MRKSVLPTVLAFTSIYASTLLLIAAPGDLDRSFGVDGVVKTPFAIVPNIGGSVFQSDGKFILVGSRGQAASNDDFFVARFNSDGSLDTSFDADGVALIAITVREDVATNAAVQADGKIVVSGYSRDISSNYHFAVVRLNPDGTPDATFGSGGSVITPTSSGSDYANDLIVQPDNKIVVCGQGAVNGNQTFTVVRYNSNGSLDTTFSGDGITTTVFPTGLSSAQTLRLQIDGKIVVAGAAAGGDFSFTTFGIVRYNSDGSPDTLFGNNGIVVVDVTIGAARQNSAEALVIQPDNKIIAVGYSASGITTGVDFAAVRLNSDGSLDNSFGNSGKVVTPIQGNGDDYAKDVALQMDGKVVVGGIGKIQQNNTDFAVVRYNANGTLDSAFGNNGIVITSAGNSNDVIRSIKLQSDGKILAAGTAGFQGQQASQTVFVQYLVNGSREADFDGDKRADVSVFRPSNGAWYLNQSRAGLLSVQFGLENDRIVPADYDGDGKTDIAVVRSGIWYILRSSLGFTGIQFGDGNDVPQPADYDGDGKADVAVFRPSNGVWYLQRSQLGFTGIGFGMNGDKPVAGDYDGDGKADVAVNRAGIWYIQGSLLGFTGIQFGDGNDKAVPADYDGDGKTDVAVFRPSNGTWYLQRSQLGFTSVTFGIGTDLPVPADYDGDGQADVAVFRGGTWYLNRSTAGFTGVAFGAATDTPIPNAFIP